MADVRVTQAILEALASGDPSLRVTQLALEALETADISLRVTWVILEAMGNESGALNGWGMIPIGI